MLRVNEMAMARVGPSCIGDHSTPIQSPLVPSRLHVHFVHWTSFLSGVLDDECFRLLQSGCGKIRNNL